MNTGESKLIVFVLTAANFDLAMDLSARDHFEEALSAPPVFATLDGAKRWVQKDFKETYLDDILDGDEDEAPRNLIPVPELRWTEEVPGSEWWARTAETLAAYEGGEEALDEDVDYGAEGEVFVITRVEVKD
jgi:predicted MPP superfamily phosphohydrolase